MRKFSYFPAGRLIPCLLVLLCAAAGAVALAVWAPLALAPVAAAERIAAIGVAIFLFSKDLSPESRETRLFLLLFPWVGLVFSPLCTAREALPETAEQSGISPLAGLPLFCPAKAKTLRYFRVGRAMYEALLPDLEAAKQYVWLDYYIVGNGIFWDNVSRILIKKAESGLDVRVVLDGFGSSRTLPMRAVRALRKRGVKTCVFHPVRAFPTRSLNRRDHRKLAVIDGEIAYTGGVNLADEYIGERIRFGHWKDTAVRVSGEPAALFARAYAQFWNRHFPKAVPAPLPSTESPKGEIPCLPFWDDGGPRAGEQILYRIFTGAEKRLYLNTPYLAPNRLLTETLRRAALFGTDVRVMIPHIPDKKSVFLLTLSRARELARAGVQVREYTAGFLHAKSVVADGRELVVSSYNLDCRSLYLQAECGLWAQDGETARELEEDFLSCWEAGTPLRRETAAERLLSPFLRLLAPIL